MWAPSIVWHDVLDSTMDAARVHAVAGAPAGTSVAARKQRAGRGRSGAPWHSPAGGLYLTTVLWPSARWPLPSLSPAVALGLANIGRALGGEALGVKWPNDVVGRHGKVAGILLEQGRTPGGATFVLLGLGLNVTTPAVPAGKAIRAAPLPASSLTAELGKGAPLPAMAELAEVTLQLIERVYVTWQAGGFAPLQGAYDRAHAWRGQRVSAAGAGPRGETIEGEVCDVRHDGALGLLVAQEVLYLQSATLRLVAP